MIWQGSYFLPYSIVCFLVNSVKCKVNYSLCHFFTFIDLRFLNYCRVECLMHLDQWSSTRAVWAPRGHLVKYLETFVIITSEGVLLVSSR